MSTPTDETSIKASDGVEELHAERFWINVSWSLKLRWAAVAGQLATIAIVRDVMKIELPLGPLLGILLGEVVINTLLHAAFRRPETDAARLHLARHSDLIFFSIQCVDVAFLIALLYLTGGASNPFAIFLLVHLALAAQILSAPWAWGIAGLSLALFVGLFWKFQRLPELENDLILAYGALAAFSTSGVIVTYLLTRLTSELELRERQLSEARDRESQRQKLEALATLAAGAAHELASPLSTIAVVARELEVELTSVEGFDKYAEDSRLVRSEVDRCRSILDLMSAGGSRVRREESRRLTIGDLVDEILDGFPARDRVDVQLPYGEDRSVELPVPSVAQSIRAILSNGIDGSADDGRVRLEVALSDSVLRIVVEDSGTGIEPEDLSRVTDPFFTTKEPGAGMGLGLFLVKAVAERLGGELRISSELGSGTRVEFTAAN
ncbi:MAG: ATP-binding protein [Planctomycetota bacterium]